MFYLNSKQNSLYRFSSSKQNVRGGVGSRGRSVRGAEEGEKEMAMRQQEHDAWGPSGVAMVTRAGDR
jgi:hypothetical protein